MSQVCSRQHDVFVFFVMKCDPITYSVYMWVGAVQQPVRYLILPNAAQLVLASGSAIVVCYVTELCCAVLM